MALCHFALENFTAAQSELEEALAFLRDKKSSVAEYRQHAEVRRPRSGLNKGGCWDL